MKVNSVLDRELINFESFTIQNVFSISKCFVLKMSTFVFKLFFGKSRLWNKIYFTGLKLICDLYRYQNLKISIWCNILKNSAYGEGNHSKRNISIHVISKVQGPLKCPWKKENCVGVVQIEHNTFPLTYRILDFFLDSEW